MERRQAQVRWGAVFAGTVTAIGTWILLQLLGTGIGLSAIDTEQGSNLRGVGMGTGIWTVIAPLLALFVGALVGGRLAGTRDRRIGALHGVVMWGLTTVLGVFAVVSTVSAIASGVVHAGGAAASAAGSAVQEATSTSDVLQPVNDYLRQQGKPEITSDQASAIMRGIAQHRVSEGKIDRSVIVDEIARNTSMSRADAEDLANRFGEQYQQQLSEAKGKLRNIGEQAKQTAYEAGHAVGRAMLWAGIGALVALIAAVVGGALGVPTRREPETLVRETDVEPRVP